MEPRRVSAEQAKLDLGRELLGVAQPGTEAEVLPLYEDALRTLGLTVDVIDAIRAPAPERPAAPAETARERVGIVFVHGVGSQRAGDTVREFGTPLVDWLEEWHRARKLVPPFRVTYSRLVGLQRDEPASATVAIPTWTDTGVEPPRRHPAQEWVITEAWWAQRIEAPPLTTMVRWAWKRLGLVVHTLLRSSWGEVLGLPPYRNPLIQAAKVLNAWLFVGLYAFAEIALFGVLVLLAIVARLPIPQLEQFIVTRMARGLLVENVGDFYVFVYDRIQAIGVRQSVYEAINWLKDVAGCDRILVAAHSGGTIVAVDALGTADLALLPSDPGTLVSKVKDVKTLITFGAALDQAWGETKDDEVKPARRIPTTLQYTESWLNFWTPFDWAHAGQPLSAGPAQAGTPGSIRVTNGMNPANDHGNYLTNFEQFISRLAQEADVPSGPAAPQAYRGSRFWPGGDPAKAEAQKQRIELRYDRVERLIVWRSLAIAATFAVVLGRYVFGSLDPFADGTVMWALIAKLPVVGLLVTGIGVGLDNAVKLLGGVAPAAGAVDELHRLLVKAPTLLGVGLVMAAAYALFVVELFGPWNEKASRSSAREDPLPQADALRTLTVLYVVWMTALAAPFVFAPQFAEIPAWIARGFGG